MKLFICGLQSNSHKSILKLFFIFKLLKNDKQDIYEKLQQHHIIIRKIFVIQRNEYFQTYNSFYFIDLQISINELEFYIDIQFKTLKKNKTIFFLN